MRARTVLTEDASGRWSLVVSLPDGRHQLSLDRPAVDLLREGFGLGVGTVVPDAVVPVIVATGDARLPGQEDAETTVAAVPSGGSLTDRQRTVLAEYLASASVDPDDAALVERIVEESPVADLVDPGDLTADARDGPGYREEGDAPASDADEKDRGSTTVEPDRSTEDGEAGRPAGDGPDSGDARPVRDDAGPVPDEAGADGDVADPGPSTGEEATGPGMIRGIGETRAETLATGGFTSVREVADAQPADVASFAGLSASMARVAVEGARELVGEQAPVAHRLAARTGVDAETFESALSALAASGVPPSEAAPVLERLYGPSIVEVEGLSGKQAYFLWEAGYRTPADLAEAEPEALQEVSYVGAKTAPEVVAAARAVVPDAGQIVGDEEH